MTTQLPTWKRSHEGYVESHCGRYSVSPLYLGCETLQLFEAVFNPTGEKVTSCASTQRAAKTACKWHAQAQARASREVPR